MKTDDLVVAFSDGTVALQNVSLEAKSGEFIAIVGPSGCGKSTLLRAIAGLQDPSRGTIDTQGSQMSIVFQDPTLLPWLTALGNVQLPLRLAGISAQESHDRAVMALSDVGLSEHQSKLPRELSGGMRMRVSVARALVTKPNVFLFDEPFAAVDAIKRQTLNEMLLQLHDERRFSALFVTHSVSEAVFLADRVVVFSQGPGTVVADIPVTLDRPRKPEQLFEQHFNDICRLVSEVLRGSEEPL